LNEARNPHSENALLCAGGAFVHSVVRFASASVSHFLWMILQAVLFVRMQRITKNFTKLICLPVNCLVWILCRLVICFFCHRILRSHALKNQILKKFRHGADTNVYKYLLLGSRPVVILSLRPVCKIVFFKLIFYRHVATKNCVISYVKIFNESKCFSSRLSWKLECSKPLAHNVLQICDGRDFQHKCSFGELHFH
jgi:Ni,Fe-hydrogenase I cytochrome b subunit